MAPGGTCLEHLELRRLDEAYLNSLGAERRVRMDFSTFRQSLMLIPAQIIRTSRRLIYRLLSWTPSLTTLFRLHDGVSQPLRC